MTGNEGRTGAPLGPPWSVDTLADLHAGVLDDATAGRLHTQIAGDADAQAVLAALATTTAELADLGRVPAPRIPDAVAARIDMALAQERATQQPQQPLAPVVSLAERRKRRNRIAGWGLGVVAAAAAVAAVVGTVLPSTIGGTPTEGNVAAPPAGQPGAAPPLALDGNGALNGGLAARATGTFDYGGLSDLATRTRCLAANDADVQQVIGARRVTLAGQDGVLFVLTTGEKGTFRLLAVQPGCTAGNPATLADTTPR